MTTAAPAAAPTLRDVASRFPTWLREHGLAALTSVVLAGAIGYISNVLLIAVHYNGFNKVPSGAPATSRGNFFDGALFWGLCMTVVFGIGNYWHAVGTTKFLADVRDLPRALGALLRGDRGAYVHLLWGAAVSMLAAQIISPAAGSVLAVGLLVAAPGVLGSIFSAALHRIWSQLVRSIAPTRGYQVTGITGAAVGLLGAAASLLVATLVHDTTAKYVLAGCLAAAAIVLSLGGTSRPTTTTVILVLIGTVLMLHGLADAQPAYANDGGTSECIGQSWLSCQGSHTVLQYAGVGGGAAAAGGLLGAFLGNLAGFLSPGGPGGFGGPDGSGGPGGPGGGPGGAGDTGGGPGTQAPSPDLVPTAPLNIPYTDALAARLRALNNALTNSDDPRYQQLQSLLTGIDPARGMTPDQMRSLETLETQQIAVDNTNEQELAKFFKPHQDAFQRRVDQLGAEAAAWQQQQQADSDAQRLLGEIRELARRHGLDQIVDHAYYSPDFLTGDDGHLNLANVQALQRALHNQLAIDRGMPPEVDVLSEGTWGSLETAAGLVRSLPVRAVAGWMSLGSSEVLYQPLDVLDAIHNGVNAAYDQGDRNGQNFNLTDGYRNALSVLAHANLPINNLENLVRLARGGDVGVSDFLKGGVMDLLGSLNVQHTAANAAESINALQYANNLSDVLSALHTGQNLYQGLINRLQTIGDMGYGIDQPGGGLSGYTAVNAPFDPNNPITLTPNMARQMGISDAALKQAQMVADKNLAAVDIRETTPLAPDKPFSADPTTGYQPKPGYVLSKSINEADGFIGGPGKSQLGAVGFFLPIDPATLPPPDVLEQQVRAADPEYTQGRIDQIVDDIPKRLASRAQEQLDYGQKMSDLTGLSRDQHGIDIHDGVVYPAGQSKPFVGDHDLYSVQLLQTTAYKVPPAGQPNAPVSAWVTKSVSDLKQAAGDAWNPSNPSGMTDAAGNPVGGIPVMEYTSAAGAHEPIVVQDPATGADIPVTPPGGWTKQAIVGDAKQNIAGDLGQAPYRAQHGAQCDFAGDDPTKYQDDLSHGGKVNIDTRDKYLPDNPKGNNLIRVQAGPAPPTLTRDTGWAAQRPIEVQKAFDALQAAGRPPIDPSTNQPYTDPQKWRPPPGGARK
jgi:hypothetical protein